MSFFLKKEILYAIDMFAAAAEKLLQSKSAANMRPLRKLPKKTFKRFFNRAQEFPPGAAERTGSLMVTSSSALEGCIPIVLSKSFFASRLLTATANP